MNQLEIIKLVDGLDVVESALSEDLVDQLASLGMERQNIMMYYALSHNGDSQMKLFNLAEKLVDKIANTRIKVMDEEGKPLSRYGDEGEVKGASVPLSGPGHAGAS